MLSFGVTVLPDPPYQRMLELMQLAEQHGFEYAWTYDSHILWEESYATLPLAAAQTSKIKLGHFVTNPGIRELVRDDAGHLRRPDGDGNRPRRLLAASRWTAARQGRGVRATLRDDQGLDERPRRSVERQRARAEVGA